MERNIADLGRFIMSSPRYRFYPLPMMVLLGLYYVILGDLVPVIAIIVSFFGGICLDLIATKAAKAVFPLRRTFFLNFVVTLLWSLPFFLFSAVAGLIGISFDFLILFVAMTVMIRVITLYPYFSESAWKQLLPTFNTVIPFGVAYFALMHNSPHLAGFLVSIASFAVTGMLFTHFSTSPFVSKFNEKPVRAMNFILNLRSSSSSREMGNKLFESLYSKERDVPVKVIDILNTDGERKVTLVFPYIHPGPFGNFGSSNLPIRLSEKLEFLDGKVMVFHTATTNSNNCRGDDDITAVAESVRKAIDSSVTVNRISRYRRFKISGHVVGMLRLDDNALIPFIPEQKHFDDVFLNEAIDFENDLKKNGASEVITVDGQNSFRDHAPTLGELKRFLHGTLREFGRLSPKYVPVLGHSSVTFETPGLGPMGIQALALKTGDKTSVIVLTDSNNVERELIDRVRSSVKEPVDNLEIFTTDNHFVNETNLDMNPLGKRDDKDLVVSKVLETVSSAIRDAEEVRIKLGTSHASVHMGDESLFNSLQETIFKSLRRAKRIIVPLIVAGILASWIAIALI